MESMTKGIGPSELIDFTTKADGEQYGFWGLIVLMGNSTNRGEDALQFFKECTGYIMGIESTLEKEYPDVGFGDFARKYMHEKTNKITDYYFND